jgi:hypothetical protein
LYGLLVAFARILWNPIHGNHRRPVILLRLLRLDYGRRQGDPRRQNQGSAPKMGRAKHAFLRDLLTTKALHERVHHKIPEGAANFPDSVI